MGPSVSVSRSVPVVKRLLAASFPGWKGRKVSVEVAAKVFYDPVGGGGSYDKAVAVELASGRLMALPSPSPFGSSYGKMVNEGVELPEGMALLVHSMFCGKDAGVRIYVNPASLPAAKVAGLLPPAEVL